MNKKSGKPIKQDWIKIKQEFLISEYVEAYVFLRERYNLDPNTNGAVARRMKGWSNEKLWLKQQGFEKAKTLLIDSYLPKAEDIAQIHKGIITLLKAYLQKELTDCLGQDTQSGEQRLLKMPNILLLERIWKIIKAEELSNKPIQNNELNISPEEMELLQSVLDENL